MWLEFWSHFSDAFWKKKLKMKRYLSYRKIRCFVRVTSFKKASDAVKKCIVFVRDVFIIFR